MLECLSVDFAAFQVKNLQPLFAFRVPEALHSDGVGGGVGGKGEERSVEVGVVDAHGGGGVVEHAGVAPGAPEEGVEGRVHVVAGALEAYVVAPFGEAHVGHEAVGEVEGAVGEGVGEEEERGVGVGVDGDAVEVGVALPPGEAHAALLALDDFGPRGRRTRQVEDGKDAAPGVEHIEATIIITFVIIMSIATIAVCTFCAV